MGSQGRAEPGINRGKQGKMGGGAKWLGGRMKEGLWGTLKHRRRSKGCWADGGGKWTTKTWGKPGCKLALLGLGLMAQGWAEIGAWATGSTGGKAPGQGPRRVPRALAALPLPSAQSALICLHPTFWLPLACLTPHQTAPTVLSSKGAGVGGGADQKVREDEGGMWLPLPEEPVQLP